MVLGQTCAVLTGTHPNTARVSASVGSVGCVPRRMLVVKLHDVPCSRPITLGNKRVQVVLMARKRKMSTERH